MPIRINPLISDRRFNQVGPAAIAVEAVVAAVHELLIAFSFCVASLSLSYNSVSVRFFRSSSLSCASRDRRSPISCLINLLILSERNEHHIYIHIYVKFRVLYIFRVSFSSVENIRRCIRCLEVMNLFNEMKISKRLISSTSQSGLYFHHTQKTKEGNMEINTCIGQGQVENKTINRRFFAWHCD